MFHENYQLLLIIPCKIANITKNTYIAITLQETKIFFFKFRIVAGSLPHKSRNLGIKISHGCREIAFCPVGYFKLSHTAHKPHQHISLYVALFSFF